MTTPAKSSAPKATKACEHENREYVRVLPFFAGEGAVWRCTDCKKKFIIKEGENFLSAALRK